MMKKIKITGAPAHQHEARSRTGTVRLDRPLHRYGWTYHKRYS